MILGPFLKSWRNLCVSIFGSARTNSKDPYYLLAEEVAYKITSEGYGVISGVALGLWRLPTKGRQEAEVSP